MWAAVEPLITPLNYLRVRHRIKRLLDFHFPLAGAGFVMAVILFLPERVPILGPGGIISVITDLLQILVGFYIAALAAVATFANPAIDRELDGDPMLITVKRRGQKRELSLTRRRLLSLLFGYLAFLSLSLYFAGSVANLLRNNLVLLIPVELQAVTGYFFLFFYLFLTANLITTTLFGLHYLAERVHR